MKQESKSGLGAVQVHKHVIEEIIFNTIKDIHGVTLNSSGIGGGVMRIFGKKSFPGIHVKFDRNDNVTVNVDVSVYFGMNIPKMASAVQDAIKEALDKTVNINLKDINVTIQGIERGGQA